MKTRILFVCVENSNRSQMAEAFARIHGGNLVEAQSAGSNPSGKVNPRAVKAMAELGYDLNSHFSKSTRDFSGQVFDYLITMGCGDECPWLPAKHRLDWEIPDPRHLEENEFRQVRDMIEIKVRSLLAELQVEK
ncbi:MAG: arsenate reductase ArsC [Spirochaetia bacterium]|nr:arsenate reductase ArsC [Spirochaetia bacterium]